jgi:CPA2 family monovalent cation:H+ antiporter-2
MHVPILEELVIILGLSMVVLLLGARLRIPPIVGFLITGVVAGPHGLGLVQASERVEVLAEVGVVLLMFTIGLEFSFKSLVRIKKTVLLGGSTQVIITLGVGMLVAVLMGWKAQSSAFVGALVALSSTAIVLKLLQDRAQMETPHGQASLGILIFQDVSILPMMLAIPLLAGTQQNSDSPAVLVGKFVALIVGLIVTAKWVLPKVFEQIVRTRSSQLFLVSVIAVCFAIATGASMAGLSLSLGAFLAGLVLSESEYSHQALGNVLPFRDVFTSLFFVSVGMLMDVRYLAEHPLLVASIGLGVIVGKTLIAGGATLLLGLPMRTAVLVGLGLAQVGEFSFVLAKSGLGKGLIDQSGYQLFLAVSVLTMVTTPACMSLAPKVAAWVDRLPLSPRLKGLPTTSDVIPLQDHIIIVGFGPSGRHLARAARVSDIPYAVVEMNADTVRVERAKGEPITFGDASQEAVLEHVGLHHARILVVVISDAAAAGRAVEVARRLNPGIHIVTRTRFVSEVESLQTLGANEVIPEDLESSVEIFTRVLTHYLVPRDRIDQLAADIRAGGYEKLRSPSVSAETLQACKVPIPDVQVSACPVAEGSPLAGKTLAEVDLRNRLGATLLAIRRGEETISNPKGSTRIEAQDTLLVLTSVGRAGRVSRVCSGTCELEALATGGPGEKM